MVTVLDIGNSSFKQFYETVALSIHSALKLLVWHNVVDDFLFNSENEPKSIGIFLLIVSISICNELSKKKIIISFMLVAIRVHNHELPR